MNTPSYRARASEKAPTVEQSDLLRGFLTSSNNNDRYPFRRTDVRARKKHNIAFRAA
ncbi:MAG: hypothetical protein ACO3JL_13960 [Myxococcota bacterium]